MAKREEIHLTFDETTGECIVEAVGFQGSACALATKSYTDALGGRVTESRKTADYHKRPKRQQAERVRS